MDSDKLLASISNVSEETEFYTPIPAGYKRGKTKYVVVFGTVMSGLGKGIFSSSLAKILKDKGLTVAPIKLEGYLNLDSGSVVTAMITGICRREPSSLFKRSAVPFSSRAFISFRSGRGAGFTNQVQHLS